MDLAVPLLAACTLTLAALWREHRQRRFAELAGHTALLRAGNATRLLRLASSDLRGLALNLLGHAQGASPSPDPQLCGLARRLLDLSDDLLRQTEAPGDPRRLTEEVMDVVPVLEFAVAQVAAQLGAGRRAWRIAAQCTGAQLHADRRALNQIMVNVLTAAAAATREGDWIDISCTSALGEWTIIVEDEGVGLPVVAPEGQTQQSRGLGLNLILAQSLMQAHGGALHVESLARIGTRVRLAFPGNRLRGSDKEGVLS